jgi:hypothetical protein
MANPICCLLDYYHTLKQKSKYIYENKFM